MLRSSSASRSAAKAAALVVVCLLLVVPARAGIRPLVAEYELLWQGAAVAEVAVTLAKESGSDVWHSRAQITPVGVVNWFIRALTVDDRFVVGAEGVKPLRVDLMRGGRVYEYYRFARNGISVLYEGRTYSLPAYPNALSQVTMLLQLAARFPGERTVTRHRLTSRGKVREYEVVRRAREMLQTGVGKVEAHVVDFKRRGTIRYRYWLSAEHGYLPVRGLRLGRDGEKRFELVVKRIELR